MMKLVDDSEDSDEELKLKLMELKQEKAKIKKQIKKAELVSQIEQENLEVREL